MSQIIEIDDKIGKPHNDKPITKIEISPNEKYLVTYSKEDNSIFGWNVNYVDEGQLDPINIFKIPDKITINQLCVSDDMKLVYIESTELTENQIRIYDMKDNSKIELDYDLDEYEYCTFNLNGEFILYNRDSIHKGLQNVIIIYSTKIRNDKWTCKRMYRIPMELKLIISQYNNLYLFANNSIYEWDILTKKSIKIFGSDEMNYNDMLVLRKDLKIIRNKKFICTRIKDKIIIYSIELEIPIASLDINNDIQIYNYMKRIGLNLPLLPPLLSTTNDVQTTTEYTFRIQDGYVWKAENSDEFDDTIKINKETYETHEHLNIHLFSPYVDTIRALFQDIESNFKYENKLDSLKHNSIRWEIRFNDPERTIILQVFNVNSDELAICKRIENFNTRVRRIFLLGIELLNDDNDIILITSIGLFIYHLNERNKSISLNYFYYTELHQDSFRKNGKIFLKENLPSPNYDSFKISNEWVSYVKDNKESLLKYGVELLTFAIKEQRLELVDDIYKKCIKYFKEDLRNNRMYLNIITSTMPYFNEYFPDYISKYSLETAMIIDNPTYNTEYRRDHKSHLHSFQYPQIVDLTKSILWLRYNTWMKKLSENHVIMYIIIEILIILLILPIFPIYFVIFSILSKYHFINDAYANGAFSIYYNLVGFFKKKYSRHRTTQIITFMIPYVKFVNYPQDYNWFLELILPKPSPFVNTISSDIYKTLDGEALINFKWNTYGKYYHKLIWIGYAALLGCFDAAAGIPQQHISANIINKLLIASIILGCFHLIFEVRQFIYDPAKWIRSVGNIIDTCIYMLPTLTSILWLQKSDKHQIIPFITFSCLLLNLKLISFFRIFEIYDEYYAIVIRIAKRVMFFFACFIMVILASFAFAFYILLSPKMDYPLDERIVNDDPNNPWSLTATYQLFENETSTSPNLFISQKPDENTNMFTNYANSLFATCLLLTGDTSSLSNWPYEKNPTLMVLMILFAFATAIYILNVFITLFGEAIQNKDESYLIMKAEYLVKIELFYLLPYQRRGKSWFPEVIHYHASMKKTRKEIKKMIENKEWKTKEFPELKRKLTDKLEIEDDTGELQTPKEIHIDKVTTLK